MAPQPFLKNRKKRKTADAHGGQLKHTIAKILDQPEIVFDYIYEILFSFKYVSIVMAVLLPVELFLNIGIVLNVKYTNIDWDAYMQEVEGFINGTFNYYELKGDTGPLVYPAGFVYIYTLFYAITDKGSDIRLAQYLFIAIYLVFMGFVFFIYKQSKKEIPAIAFVIMCLTSHRIHSIFVLRLFNDPIAMLFLYISIACFIKKFWRVGCIAFSVGVSIKMNIILFAPGLFIILVLTHGLIKTIFHIALCALVQLILGSPFLFTFPVEYMHMSFDLGRQFFYKWTVNWKCVPENIFLAKPFQMALLALHIIVLVAFLNKSLKNVGGLKGLFTQKKKIKLCPSFIVHIMFVSNFIGICFSRSLHYQFYVWYYHTIAYLLWSTKYPTFINCLIFGVIELCWNVYPATFYSSIGLNLCHLIMLIGVWTGLDTNNFFRINKDM